MTRSLAMSMSRTRGRRYSTPGAFRRRRSARIAVPRVGVSDDGIQPDLCEDLPLVVPHLTPCFVRDHIRQTLMSPTNELTRIQLDDPGRAVRQMPRKPSLESVGRLHEWSSTEMMV